MKTENTPGKNQIRIYGAGGGGINMVSEIVNLTKVESSPMPGFAEALPCYIDTSASNLRGKKIPEDQVYIFDGIDGSGKIRSMNYDEITKNAKSLLLQFKPSEFNIVIHTAGGGSGSVIASVLVSELKARGHQVVVIVTGSTDTRIEVENTIKTLKTYESIAAKRESPIVVQYLENSAVNNRGEINRHVLRMVVLLLGLFSGEHKEIDTADLKNWLEYTRITKTKNCLASLNICLTDDDIEKAGTIISVATLSLPGMNTRLSKTPAYQCTGIAPDAWSAGNDSLPRMIGDAPIHFCISDDFITESSDRLNKTLKEIDVLFNSRNARDSIIDKNDNTTSDGIIL